MKSFFTSDIKTKLLSLGIAVVLWIYLVVVLNPEVDTTIGDVPITYSGHLALTKNNYEITNQTKNFVDIKLRGSRNMLANVNKNNIIAYIDLTGYNQTGTFSLPIHVRLPYEEITVLEKNPYNINVAIDRIITQQFKVETKYSGTTKSGYAVYNPTSTQSIIEVKGPKEIIKTIDKAVVEVNIDGADKDIISTQKIKLLNSNNSVIDNKLLSVFPDKIETHCTILKSKTVPIVPVLEPNSDEYTTQILGSESITILGRDDVLNTVNEIKTTPISVGRISGSMQIHAPLVIPNDIYTLQDNKEIVVEIRHNS